MIASRVWLRWTCVSRIIGITVLPAGFTRMAPAGTLTLAAGPACTIRAPFTTKVAFSMGARPSPTMSLAPSNAVTWARTGTEKLASTPKAMVAATVSADIRRIGSPIMELDQAIVAFLIGQGKGLRATAPPGPQSIVSLWTVWFVIFHAEGAFG